MNTLKDEFDFKVSRTCIRYFCHCYKQFYTSKGTSYQIWLYLLAYFISFIPPSWCAIQRSQLCWLCLSQPAHTAHQCHPVSPYWYSEPNNGVEGGTDPGPLHCGVRWKVQMREETFLTAKVAVQQAIRLICLSVCLCVYKVEIYLLKVHQPIRAQFETNWPIREQYFRSAVSAEINYPF